MAPPIIVTEDTPPDMLAGSMDLTVVLPDGHSQKMSVERSTPMMDLLVQVTTANKMSPAGYIIKPHNERGLLPYKPSTPIGALDAWTIHIVPKQQIQCTAVKKPYKTFNQPFEQTFRLQVHLPRNQLYVARVSPKTRLADIILQVCSEKNLDPVKYSLRHPCNLDQVLNLSCTLADYKLQEVTLVCNRTHPVEVSTVDIMSLQRDTTNPAYRNTMCEGSVSSGSLEGRSLSPVPSDESSASPPPLPPSRPTRKRRPAPKPPTICHKPINEEKQQNGIQSTVINHSRNSSDSSGYHEASVLSESPQSTSVPDSMSRHKMSRVSEVPLTSVLSQSMTDVAVIEPTLKQATSYNSITSLSSGTGRKKKSAPPPPPVAKDRASSVNGDQQRTPSISSTASSTTTLDGNELNSAVKSATLPPSSRLNSVSKDLSLSPSPPPTTKVDIETPVTPQAAPAPRPRSKLLIDSEGSQSDPTKLANHKKAPAPQPRPKQRVIPSKSIENDIEHETTEKIKSPEETKSHKDQFMNKKLPTSVFKTHKACIDELVFKFERKVSIDNMSEASEDRSDDREKSASELESSVWETEISNRTDISSTLDLVNKETHEHQESGDVTVLSAEIGAESTAWVVGANTEPDENTLDVRMADEEIDRIFTDATKNHINCDFGIEDEQVMSLSILPSPPLSLMQQELKQSSQSDDPLDWEYRLPAPPTFRDETKSPTVTEFGTVTIGNLGDVLCAETVHKNTQNKNDIQETIVSINLNTDDLSSSESEILRSLLHNEDSPVNDNMVLPSKDPNTINTVEFDNSSLKESGSEDFSNQNIDKNVINELSTAINHKPVKVENAEFESKYSSQQLTSTSTLDNFTITTYKDTKPIEVFEDDSIKSSVGEKRDKSKDDAVFRAPKPRVKEPNLSRTSSFSMENKLNGPIIKRSVSYVSLLAANMPRTSQPYRAHLLRQNSCATRDSDMWPQLRKTTSELNIDNEDDKRTQTSFWRDDPAELQSIQVLRNILSQSQANLSSTQDESHLQHSDPPVSDKRFEDRFESDADSKKWGRSQSEDIIKWSDKPKMEHSLSLDQEHSKHFTNSQRGPPSINLSTWTERPKRQISIKNDCDYTFGLGKKSIGQDEYVGSAVCANKDPTLSSKIVHSINGSVRVELSKNESFQLKGKSKSVSDLSRIPIVRSVELKKPLTSHQFDRRSLKPVQIIEDINKNKPVHVESSESDDAFVGVNSLARRFGVPQKRPASMYVSNHHLSKTLQPDINESEKSKTFTNISNRNEVSNVNTAQKIDEISFRSNAKADEFKKLNTKVCEVVDKTDSTTSEIKAQAKIRSGGFVDNVSVVSSSIGSVSSNRNHTAINDSFSRRGSYLELDKCTFNDAQPNIPNVNCSQDSRQSIVSDLSSLSKHPPTHSVVSIGTVYMRQNQIVDRKPRPLSLQPVVKGFRISTETSSSLSKDLIPPSTSKTKELKTSVNLGNSDSLSQRGTFPRALTTSSISSFLPSDIKDTTKEKSSDKVCSVASDKTKTVGVIPPPPPLVLPVLKPIGHRKGVKLLPPPEADPRGLLMESIRSFGKVNLKKVSK